MIVSILGLVDKGLRQCEEYIALYNLGSFNPWFSG